MEAEAEHDFVPNDPSTELPFQKGDKLLIHNYGDQVEWYDASINGQRGLVPNNYIRIHAPNWYCGRTSRAKAEQILQGAVVEGAFLIRLSESAPLEFSLSVKCGNSVQHFRILKNEQQQFFLWSGGFNSLNELVEHYRTESVSRTSSILLRDMTSEHVVVAMYDFSPKPDEDEDESRELGFRKGDLITVFDDSDEHWWGGCIGDRKGYFPKTYVQPYH